MAAAVYIVRELVLCIAILLCLSGGVFAQNISNPDSDMPLEIVAKESLEWHRGEMYFQARKEVRAEQGDTTLYCDKMIARYRDSEEKNIDIYRVEAFGNVRIISADSKAYGDKAVYNIDKGFARLTGGDLRLVSEDQDVQAHDEMIYWVAKGRLEAIGKAVVVREGDKIEADKLIATFADDKKSGKRTLKMLEAVGNVIITTPDEVLMGKSAFYSAKTGVAQLKDEVRIFRGESFLEGAWAELNLNTNISKIFGSDSGIDGENLDNNESGDGRVRAVFFPG